jgi:hypothetical protein
MADQGFDFSGQSNSDFGENSGSIGSSSYEVNVERSTNPGDPFNPPETRIDIDRNSGNSSHGVWYDTGGAAGYSYKRRF